MRTTSGTLSLDPALRPALEDGRSEYLGAWQEELETQAVHLMDSVLGQMPNGALKVADESDTTESSGGSLSEGESESSHEAGWEGESVHL